MDLVEEVNLTQEISRLFKSIVKRDGNKPEFLVDSWFELLSEMLSAFKNNDSMKDVDDNSRSFSEIFAKSLDVSRIYTFIKDRTSKTSESPLLRLFVNLLESPPFIDAVQQIVIRIYVMSLIDTHMNDDSNVISVDKPKVSDKLDISFELIKEAFKNDTNYNFLIKLLSIVLYICHLSNEKDEN